MVTVITGAAAIIPSLCLLLYVVRKDVFPEPTHVIIKTFLLGILIVVPLVFVESLLDQYRLTIADAYLRPVFRAFAVAAAPEELFKFAVLMLFCVRHSHFDEPMDGIVYGAVASLGFATFENVMYVVQGGLPVAVMRAFTAVPAHACFGAIMGFYVGQGVFGRISKGRSLLLGLGIPVVLHGLYDIPPFVIAEQTERRTLTAGVEWACLVGLILVMIYLVSRTLRHIAHLRAEQMATTTGRS